MLKSAEIQEQINSLDLAIQQGAADAQLNLWEMQKADAIKARDAALAEEAQQAALEQAHEVRVSDAKEKSNYLLDDILIAGVPVAECGMAEADLNILRSKVQYKFVEQASGYSDLIKGYEEREVQLQRQNVELQKDYSELQTKHADYAKEQEQVVYQLEQEVAEVNRNRANAVSQLEEAKADVERLNNQVDEQRKVITLGVRGELKVIESTDEQIKRQEAELKASRIKVTSMVKSDPSGISDRLWDIVLLETGEQKQINYLEKGKYTLIGEEDAARFRQEAAEKAQREADIQATIPDMGNVQKVAELTMPEQTKVEELTQEDFRNGSDTVEGRDVVQSGADVADSNHGNVPDSTQERRQNSVSRTEIEARFKRIENELNLKSWRFDSEDVA